MGSRQTDDFIGWMVGGAIFMIVVVIAYPLTRSPDPCRASAVEFRQELIDAHERCMIEENCIYEDRDIRKYDARLESNATCEANRNED